MSSGLLIYCLKKDGYDWVLPDVHFLSVYLLVKVLQEEKKDTLSEFTDFHTQQH